MRVAGVVPPVLGLCASALVLGLGAQHERPAPGADEFSVPERMAGYSYLTDSVSADPAGPAIALFQHGFGVEFMDFPQAVVLGAGGDTYRRVDAAEERAGRETQGDPAPMLLSPDGSYVAVGDHDTTDPDVLVVDLTTGEATTHPLPQGRSVIPVAWSSDGTSLASLVSSEPTNPYSGSRITGDVALLDLSDDSAEVLDVDGAGAAAAFSPDGSELAVERSAPREVSVVDLADGSARGLPLDGVLAGPNAWSPDGRMLAVTTVRAAPTPPGVSDPGIPTGLALVDATGASGAVPQPLELAVSGPGRVLAWNGPDEVVMLLDVEGSDSCCGPDSATLSSVPLDGSAPTALMQIDDLASYGVGRFQLASSAGGRLQVVSPDGIDRGPWPLPIRIGAAALAGLAVWLMARLVVRLAGRRRRARQV